MNRTKYLIETLASVIKHSPKGWRQMYFSVTHLRLIYFALDYLRTFLDYEVSDDRVQDAMRELEAFEIQQIINKLSVEIEEANLETWCIENIDKMTEDDMEAICQEIEQNQEE